MDPGEVPEREAGREDPEKKRDRLPGQTTPQEVLLEDRLNLLAAGESTLIHTVFSC